MKTRATSLVIGVAAASAGLTALVAFVPQLDFAYRNPDLHVALQTSEALVGLLAAFLVLGRFRRTARLDDLLLGLAFGVLATGNLFFAAGPAALAGDDTSAFATWSAVISRLVGAGLMAAAALAPPRRLRLPRARAAALTAAPVLVTALVAGLVWALAGRLPSGVDTSLADDSGLPRFDVHAAVLAAQLIGLVLWAVAAAGFLRRAQREGDAFLRWLAVGSVLAAAARLNYALYPSVFTEFVYTGDFFRLGFYLLVLGAAVREITVYWRSAAEVAALEERRRIARDLHDGLAQELASIGRNLAWLDQQDRFVRRARAAAARALDESRRAIAALSGPWEQPLDVVLTAAARAVADREGTEVVMDVDRSVRLRPAEREALVMIASEAITNAAKHADADLVRVELSSGDAVRLRVSDTGRGFDPAGVRVGDRSGFGLTSMRDRATAIGARLRIESTPGAGTRVEVVL